MVGAALQTALARLEQPPLVVVPARVHRVTVVGVLAPCLGELEDGLEGRGVSPDDVYNQMFKWFGGSYRSAWDT